jgi:hypothetical protein
MSYSFYAETYDYSGRKRVIKFEFMCEENPVYRGLEIFWARIKKPYIWLGVGYKITGLYFNHEGSLEQK